METPKKKKRSKHAHGERSERKEKRRKEKREKKHLKAKRERKSQIVQPTPSLSPADKPSYDSPPGSARVDAVRGHDVVLAIDDLMVRKPHSDIAAAVPLPPLATSSGYVGQYVQSALTGDFRRVNQVPTTNIEDKQKRKTDTAGTQRIHQLRTVLKGINTFGMHVRAAVLFLSVVVYLIVRRSDSDDELIWLYQTVSDDMQKLLNITSFLCFACTLCSLSVAQEVSLMNYLVAPIETLSPEKDKEVPDSGCASCCAGNLTAFGIRELTTAEGSGRGRLFSFDPLIMTYFVSSCLYAAVVICSLITAAFDDVLWMYRDDVEIKYSPAMNRLLTNGRKLEYIPPPANWTFFDDWQRDFINSPPPVDCPAITDAQLCLVAGCCYLEGEGCAFATSDPQRRDIALLPNPELPLYWNDAARTCTEHGQQLCTRDEICATQIHNTLDSVAVGDEYGAVTTCADPTKRSNHTFMQINAPFVFCCRFCPAASTNLLDTEASISSRVGTFKTVVSVRLFLSVAGVIWGLWVQLRSDRFQATPPTPPSGEDGPTDGPAGKRGRNLSSMKEEVQRRQTV